MLPIINTFKKEFKRSTSNRKRWRGNNSGKWNSMCKISPPGDLPNPRIKPESPALGFPGGSDGKESACNAGDPGSIPGSGRSLGEGNGNPLQYSCLENPMDRGAWWATVHGVAKSRT